jgi:hypothetical protein
MVPIESGRISPMESLYLSQFVGMDRQCVRYIAHRARACPISTALAWSWTASGDSKNMKDNLNTKKPNPWFYVTDFLIMTSPSHDYFGQQ